MNEMGEMISTDTWNDMWENLLTTTQYFWMKGIFVKKNESVIFKLL